MLVGNMAPLSWHDLDAMVEVYTKTIQIQNLTQAIYAQPECATEKKNNIALTEVWED
jgi:hypothetical protein